MMIDTQLTIHFFEYYCFLIVNVVCPCLKFRIIISFFEVVLKDTIFIFILTIITWYKNCLYNTFIIIGVNEKDCYRRSSGRRSCCRADF